MRHSGYVDATGVCGRLVHDRDRFGAPQIDIAVADAVWCVVLDAWRSARHALAVRDVLRTQGRLHVVRRQASGRRVLLPHEARRWRQAGRATRHRRHVVELRSRRRSSACVALIVISQIEIKNDILCLCAI
jgi:hypothetical protein